MSARAGFVLIKLFAAGLLFSTNAGRGDLAARLVLIALVLSETFTPQAILSGPAPAVGV